MSKGTTWLGGLVGLLVWSGAVLASPEPPPASPEAAGQAEASEASDERLDARAFFEALAQRYRDLAAYRDTAHVVQVTETRATRTDEADEDEAEASDESESAEGGEETK